MIRGQWNALVFALIVFVGWLARPQPIPVGGAPAHVASILYVAEQKPLFGIQFDRTLQVARAIRLRGDSTFLRWLGDYITYGDTLNLLDAGCVLTRRGARLYDPASCVEPGVTSYRTKDEDPAL